MRHIFLTCILLLAVLTTMAQPRHFFFNHFVQGTGLASNQVNDIMQDEEGFIWIATNEGLQRFDGVHYRNFQHRDNDPYSIASNLVWQLLPGKDHNLWILTIDGKVGIFNTHTLRFSPVPVKTRNEKFLLASSPLKRMILDEYGHVFLLLPGSELIWYNPEKKAFTPEGMWQPFKEPLKIKAFNQEPGSSRYWFSTEEVGLAVYDSHTGTLSYPGHNTGQNKALDALGANKDVNVIYFDRYHRLWIVNTVADIPAISCYDLRKNYSVTSNYTFNAKELGYHEVRSFYQQTNGAIWVVGQQVFARWMEKEKTFEHVYNGTDEEHGINFIMITSLAEDRDHAVWLGTGNNGMFRFNPSKEFFSNTRYISYTTGREGGGSCTDFFPDKDGSLLVGIREDGLYRFDSSMKQMPLNIKGIPNKNSVIVLDMVRDLDTNIVWMAVREGLYKYDQRTRSATLITPELLKSKTVRRLGMDWKGNLWIGTLEAGLFHWSREKGTVKFEDGLSVYSAVPAVRINKVFQDSHGMVWVAAFNDGGYMIDPNTLQVKLRFSNTVTGETRIPEQSVGSILEYNDSLMVIGCNARMLLYNRKTGKSELLENTLSGFVASMEKDRLGHIWVSTTTSIYRVTLATRAFVHFNRNDGLENDYFLQNASRTLPNGKIIFGSYGVMILFYPEQVKPNPATPDLRIADFTVNEVQLRVDSLLSLPEIRLSPSKNGFTIDLSPMAYNAGLQGSYRLDPLDKDWRTLNEDYRLVYSYLPSGRYTLNVRLTDAEGVELRSLQLNIVVDPVFWKTWWFLSVMALILLALIYWFDRMRLKRLQSVLKMRTNIATHLHRDINNTINDINILSELANIKTETEPQKSKEFIGQIQKKSGELVTAMDDMVWSINPDNDRPHKNIERMQEFIDGLNSSRSAGIDLQVDDNVRHLKLDMQFRHDLLQLFRSSTQAAVNSGAKDVLIHIGLHRDGLQYDTVFDPHNCDIQLLRNLLGAKDMEETLRQLGAKRRVEVKPGRIWIGITIPVE